MVGAPLADVATPAGTLGDAGKVRVRSGADPAMRSSVSGNAAGGVLGSALAIVPDPNTDDIDLERDRDGSIRTSVESFTAWMEDRPGGRALRIDRCQGLADVGFERLDETGAALSDGDTLRNLGAAMLGDGLREDDRTINLVYDEGTNDTCGNADNPSMPGPFSLGVIDRNGACPDPNVLP